MVWKERAVGLRGCCPPPSLRFYSRSAGVGQHQIAAKGGTDARCWVKAHLAPFFAGTPLHRFSWMADEIKYFSSSAPSPPACTTGKSWGVKPDAEAEQSMAASWRTQLLCSNISPLNGAAPDVLQQPLAWHHSCSFPCQAFPRTKTANSRNSLDLLI